MTREELAVHIAWSVAAQIGIHEPIIDLHTPEGLEECGKVVEEVCRKFGLDPYIFDSTEKSA